MEMASGKLAYFMGGVVGLLLTFSAAIWNNYFAPVSVYPMLTSGSIHILGFDKLNKMAFFTANHGANSYHNLFGFQTFFIIGILVGAFLASLFTGKFKISTEVPELFKQRFGNKRLLRFTIAFIGGFIMSIGAMIASGCSILYGISVFAKFDAAGIVTFIAFYLGGILANWFIYHKVK
ncbi:MAG: hypothetical protein E6Q33_04105 [Neisseriales bacterium]|nr:MAG: hypothetical protein E6Q33_04105 [Neisseriales bacterium]